MDGEIVDNNDVLRKVFEFKELFQHLKEDAIEESQKDEIMSNWINPMYETITFNWIKCPSNESIPNPYKSMLDYAINAWNTSFHRNLVYNNNDTMLSAYNATGFDECSVNIAGGSMFWLTTMTTIGFGNAIPSTNTARLLVMTFGFMSILAFTAVVGMTGYFSILVMDEKLAQGRWKSLQSGLPGVMFYFLTLVLTFFLLTILHYYLRVSHDWDQTFDDSIWFMFQSMTTCGFGDVYVPHILKLYSLFYAPLLQCFVIVCVANFLTKLATHCIPFLLPSNNDLNGPSLSFIVRNSAEGDERT